MNEIKEKVLSYAKKTYKTTPDAPFSTAPEYYVLRHGDTRKWYALFMDVPQNRLGMEGDKRVDILNIKCDPILSGSLRLRKGFLPAYHMNRENWLTILLDGTVDAAEIYPLLDMSYELTKKKTKRGARSARNTERSN